MPFPDRKGKHIFSAKLSDAFIKQIYTTSPFLCVWKSIPVQDTEMPLSTSYHWQRSKIINISLTEWCGIKMVGPIRHLAWSKKNFIRGIFWLKDLAFVADPLWCLQFFRPCRCSSTLSNLVSGSSERQKEWGPLHEWSGSNDVTYDVKVSIGIFLPLYKKKI